MRLAMGAMVLVLGFSACGGEGSGPAQSTTVGNGHRPINLRRAVDTPRPPGEITTPILQKSMSGEP